MKKIVFLLYLLLFLLIINLKALIRIKTDEEIKPFKAYWKKTLNKRCLTRKKHLHSLKIMKRNRWKVLRSVKKAFFPFKVNYFKPHSKHTLPSKTLSSDYSTKNIILTPKKRKILCNTTDIKSFFNFSGSRTTIIRLTKTKSYLNNSNIFSREDYLKLNINGKDKLQNIKANIFESNSVMDKINKTSIEAEIKNFSFFFGETQMSLEENELVLDQKTITGIDIKSKHKKSNFRFLSGQLQGQTMEEEIIGNGTHGPYFLKIKPIIPFSEEVELNNIKLEQNRDYVIDYELGQIKFPEKFIKNTDKIHLRYESQEKINKNIFALQSNINPFPFLNLGFTYLKQFSPKLNLPNDNSLQNRNLYGLKCNFDFNNYLNFHSFLAFQKTNGTSKMASASRISFDIKRPYFQTSLNYRKVGPDFRSLGSLELYPGSNILNTNLSFQNNYIQSHNEFEEKKSLNNIQKFSKRYALCKLNFFTKNLYNFGYHFTHEQEINNNENQNYSKVNHKVLLNLNTSFFSWHNSFTYTRNNSGFFLDQEDNSFGKKTSITLRKRSCILNIYYENIIKKRQDKSLQQSDEHGTSLEINPFPCLRLKADYSHYSHYINGKSDHLHLNYKLNWPSFFSSSGKLYLKTIGSEVSNYESSNSQLTSTDPLTDLSGFLKFNFLPSPKLSLEYSFLPHVTKNNRNEIIKDNSINQLNFFFAPTDTFSMQFGMQNKIYLNKTLRTDSSTATTRNYENKSLKLRYKSYLLRSSIRTKKCFSLDGQLYYDKKFENTHNFFKNIKGNLETSFIFSQKKTFSFGYEFENERQLLADNILKQTSTKSLFSSFYMSNKANTLKLKTIFKTSFQKDFNNKDNNTRFIEPSIELTFNPGPNVEGYINYSYSKSFQEHPNISEKLEASLNTHFSKIFDFKFTASYNKTTYPPIKNLNLEGVFTTTF